MSPGQLEHAHEKQHALVCKRSCMIVCLTSTICGWLGSLPGCSKCIINHPCVGRHVATAQCNG